MELAQFAVHLPGGVYGPDLLLVPNWLFVPAGGITPPLHEWKEILDDMNAKTRKLEEDYEATCITKKVCFVSITILCKCDFIHGSNMEETLIG